MKAVRSNRKITPFGGAIAVLKQIRDFKIPEYIKECLGTRVKQAKYSYEDIIISWMLTNLCGGIRLDHLSKLRKSLNVIPNLNLPSHDTLGRVMKDLASDVLAESELHRSKMGYKESIRKGAKTYKRITTRETNINEPLNKLLALTACKLGLLKQRIKHDVDFDVTQIETEVKEAKKNYKHFKGFSPMVAAIDKFPVFIEMRNGNVAPNARILESVQNCVSSLKKNNIEIGRIRMDRGGYHGPAFDFLDDNNIKFVVGCRKSAKMMTMLKEHQTWKNVLIKTTLFDWDCETADFKWAVNKSKEYRLVVLRIDRKRKRLENSARYGVTPKTWVFGGQYAYKMIITNDWTSSVEELWSFYNQRGTSEKNFDALKNDFGWKLPPFSNMNENTVFLLIAAITNNVYHALLAKISQTIVKVKTNIRLREFIYVFMSVACELTKTQYRFFDTDIAYEKIC